MAVKVLVADDNNLILAMTIILLDIMMPGIDGIEICRNLKRSPVTSPILIAIHSSKKDPPLMDLCFEAGAECFIIKTNDFEGLVDRVKQMVDEKL